MTRFFGKWKFVVVFRAMASKTHAQWAPRPSTAAMDGDPDSDTAGDDHDTSESDENDNETRDQHAASEEHDPAEPDENANESPDQHEVLMQTLEAQLQDARANGEELPASFYSQAYRAMWGPGHDIRVVGEDEDTVTVDASGTLHTFDRVAPTLHSYLGEVGDVSGAASHADLERVANQVQSDEGASTSSMSFTKTMRIPLLLFNEYMLFPGDTFPLFLGNEEDHFSGGLNEDARRVVALANAAPPPLTGFFGVVCIGAWMNADAPRLPMVGTLAEIRQIGSDSGLVAKGRVRFAVKDPPKLFSSFALDGARAVANVEVTLLSDAIVKKPSIRRINPQVTSHSDRVHDMFDPHVLAGRLRASPALAVVLSGANGKNEDEKTEKHTSSFPSDPAVLSHRVASCAPVSLDTRYELLCAETVVDRLKLELKLFCDCDTKAVSLKCASCDNQISQLENVISMSEEGPSGSYCNPAGVVHDLLTVSGVARNAVALEGTPSTEFSWFPGFAWTVAFCVRCRQHLGWEFTCVGDENTSTKNSSARFFGFTREAIHASGFEKEEQEDMETMPNE